MLPYWVASSYDTRAGSGYCAAVDDRSRRSHSSWRVPPTPLNPPTTTTMVRTQKRSPPKFPYDLPYPELDLRARPELYRIGRGEQGVLMVEPYKSELCPLWRFKTPAIAKTSSRALYEKFEEYIANDDFVGCDMARKFIQMGVTRSRRYANRKGGRKYAKPGDKTTLMPKDEVEDPVKAESARVFGRVLKVVEEHDEYLAMKEAHLKAYPDDVVWDEDEKEDKDEDA